MASKYGYTIKNLQDININKLTNDQMLDALKVMTDAANKRIKRLSTDELGRTSPAYRRLARQQGLLNEKNELQGVPKFSISRAEIYKRPEGISNKQYASMVRGRLSTRLAAVKSFTEKESSSIRSWTRTTRVVENRVSKELKNQEIYLEHGYHTERGDKFNFKGGEKDWLNAWETIGNLEAKYPNFQQQGEKGSTVIQAITFKVQSKYKRISQTRLERLVENIIEDIEKDEAERIKKTSQNEWSEDLGGNEF